MLVQFVSKPIGYDNLMLIIRMAAGKWGWWWWYAAEEMVGDKVSPSSLSLLHLASLHCTGAVVQYISMWCIPLLCK